MLINKTSLKGEVKMAQFTQTELNSIREITSCHITNSAKLRSYANSCRDPKLKQLFSSSATQSEQGASKLMQML